MVWGFHSTSTAQRYLACRGQRVEDVAVRLLASALQTKLLEEVSAAPVEPAEVVEPFPLNPSPLAARRTTVTELPRRQALW